MLGTRWVGGLWALEVLLAVTQDLLPVLLLWICKMCKDAILGTSYVCGQCTSSS